MWQLLILAVLAAAIIKSNGDGATSSYRYRAKIGKLGSGVLTPSLIAAYQVSGQINGVDWRLLASQGYQESKYRADAISYVGAGGIAQLMPATARGWGLTVPDGINMVVGGRDREFPSVLDERDERMAPTKAIGVQGQIMARNLVSYDGDVTTALGAYHSGRANIRRRGLSDGDRKYAASIEARWQAFKLTYPE